MMVMEIVKEMATPTVVKVTMEIWMEFVAKTAAVTEMENEVETEIGMVMVLVDRIIFVYLQCTETKSGHLVEDGDGRYEGID